MRQAVTRYTPNGLPVQQISTRDFLFPDVDERYVPDVLAYVHDTDIAALIDRLCTMTPPAALGAFAYLSDQERAFACRALRELWASRLAAGSGPLLPHLAAWMETSQG
jgi:hypothetical protein